MSNTSRIHRSLRKNGRVGMGIVVGSAIGAASLVGFAGAANAAETPAIPIGTLDAVTPGVGTATVSGWAIEPDATGPISVQIFVDGVYNQTVLANAERDDVAAVYPTYGALHGYATTVTGLSSVAHTIDAYGINVNGVQADNVLLGRMSVPAVPTTSFGRVDSVVSTATSVEVTGWAIDPKTTAPITVAVYVDGVFATNATASNARPDVGVAYPASGANHGYDVTIPVAAGNHTVDVYAIDSTANGNNPLLARTTTAVNATPMGAVDAAVADANGAITVSGWAFDPKTNAPVDVAVYVDSVFVVNAVASQSRVDVAAVYPTEGADHGYNLTVPAAAGAHTVDVYAIDSTADGNNPLLAQDTVTVSTTSFGNVDAVAQTTGDNVQISGWAIDPKTNNPIQVAVYVDGAPAGAFTADGARADVGAVYPTSGPNHGFVTSVPIATVGSHTVDVYAIDSTANGNNPLLAHNTVVITSSVL